MKRTTTLQLVWLMIFGISMGFFESSIVVYLRELYYPDGFSFPLQKIDQDIALAEFLREAASIIMLVSVAFIAFRSFYRRFAAFLFIFAVWDIFYYIFLKLLLDWPESMLTWDILFLIPVSWTGPVITPIIISLIMVLLAVIILFFDEKNQGHFYIQAREWIVLISGAFIVFLAFIWDYSRFVLKNIPADEINTLIKNLEILALNYTPVSFNWFLFSAGGVLILIAITLIYLRNKGENTSSA